MNRECNDRAFLICTQALGMVREDECFKARSAQAFRIGVAVAVTVLADKSGDVTVLTVFVTAGTGVATFVVRFRVRANTEFWGSGLGDDRRGVCKLGYEQGKACKVQEP